jgi:hypothetical protein
MSTNVPTREEVSENNQAILITLKSCGLCSNIYAAMGL